MTIIVVSASFVLLYVLSQVVILTKVFTTDIRVARGESALTSTELFAVLGEIDEIREDKSTCPDKLGSCWSAGGEIRIVSSLSIEHQSLLRLVTTEGRNFWTPEVTTFRHDEFVERIVAALRTEGFAAEKVVADFRTDEVLR